MAVATRQGREKPAKIEQRKVRGPELRPQEEQTALLAKPNLHRVGPGGGEKTYKRRSQSALRLSLSTSFVFLVRASALLHALLFSEDGFSCYLLNKIEL